MDELLPDAVLVRDTGVYCRIVFLGFIVRDEIYEFEQGLESVTEGVAAAVRRQWLTNALGDAG